MAEKAFVLFNIYSNLHSVSRVDPVSSITTILSLGVKKIKLFNGDEKTMPRQ